jgi:hypothetical protein
MAKTFAGGTQVSSGYYIDAHSFEFANIAKDGMTLPGGSDVKFVRIPTMVAMAAAPALGGLFVIALPLIGFGMVAYALVKRLRSGAKEVAATVVGPAMPVGSTALTGSPSEPEEEGHEEVIEPNLEQLAKEIEDKRGGN